LFLTVIFHNEIQDYFIEKFWLNTIYSLFGASELLALED